MLLSKAVEGYILDGLAGEYSPHTMRIYRLYLGKLVDYLEDPETNEITHKDLAEYMHYLRFEYVPNRPNGDKSPLSPSALDNHWKAIRSLFRWCHLVLDMGGGEEVGLFTGGGMWMLGKLRGGPRYNGNRRIRESGCHCNVIGLNRI